MANNKWTKPTNPPPRMFFNDKERGLVKQINDELLEKVVGQEILYYPIDIERTNYHPLYGECQNKSFLSPIRVYALVDWNGQETTTDNYGIDRLPSINVHFHKRRLTEDQNLEVKEGDFVVYNQVAYEIVKLNEPVALFGYDQHKVEIVATCIFAREGTFDGQ